MRNAKLIILYRFFWMFIPVIAVFVPLTRSYNFSMTDFFLLQSCFGLTVVLFEVPSGYAADLYGRKRTLIIGSIFSGIGFTLLVFSTKLWHFFIYEAILGVSLAMCSGTDFSLMFDSMEVELKKRPPSLDDPSDAKENAREQQAGYWVSKFQLSALLGEAGSSVIGGFLAWTSLTHNLVITAIVGWIPLCILYFVEEPQIQRMSQETHRDNFRQIYRHLFTNSIFLRRLFINFLTWSLSTMCAVWMIQKYWDDHHLPVLYFGCLWGALSVIAAVFSHFAGRIESLLGLKNCFLFFSGLVVSAYFAIGWSPFWVSVGLMSSFYVSRGVQSVLYKKTLNMRLNEEFRATANSIFSLAFRLSFMVIGPLMGVFIDFSKVQYLFPVMGFGFLICLVTLLVPFVKMDEFRK